MPTVKEVRGRLRGIEGHVAVAIWCEEDVIGRAAERGIKITHEQAANILDQIDHKQDCELGISWVTLDCYTDDYLAQ